MKSIIQDIIQNTHGLGVIELIKINGSAQETKISAYAEDRSVIVSGTTKQPIPEFEGIFGMPNLTKLKTIISFSEYDETSVINVTRVTKDGEDVPSAIHFETKSGDFINDYRLMSKVIVEDRVKSVKFKGANWNVEFEPSIAGIQRLKKQASANSEEANFTVRTVGNDLKVFFGDPSSHSGNFIFQSDVSGTMSKSWNWPVKVFLSIMDLAGDKTVRFSDDGVSEITVDSGLAVYKFLIPGLAK